MRSHLTTKTITAAVAALGLATAAAAGEEVPSQAPAEKAVVARVAEFAKAFNAGGAPALAALFSDDAVIVAPDGEEIRGKEAIGHMYADFFGDDNNGDNDDDNDDDGLNLEARVESVRFLTPDVARVEGRSRVSAADGDAADHLRFHMLLVRAGDAWTIAELRESPVPAEEVAPSERLKPLEWMVGRWVDESERHKVEAEVRWSEGRSFLIRTHVAELEGRPRSSATMIVGWDPQTGQIKSWSFDSEGGRSEGVWTRVGESRWIVKSQGVTRDGLPSSGTLVHTILNHDSVRTDIVDRIVGGRVTDDVVDLVLVRHPPAPGADAGAPGPK